MVKLSTYHKVDKPVILAKNVTPCISKFDFA
jgi:hypothetical protein